MGVAAKRLEGLLARVHEPRLWPIIPSKDGFGENTPFSFTVR